MSTVPLSRAPRALLGRVRKATRQRLDPNPRMRALLWLLFTDRLPILPDYPVRPRPRFGHGVRAHRELEAIFAAQRAEYVAVLSSFLELREHLERIAEHPDAARPYEPAWSNGFFHGLDAVALYGLLARNNPARYVEIGSGHSTRFARRAIRDHGLRTTITSIDPTPRAEIDAICDRMIRQRLEDSDLALFAELEPGDILFNDGSHRVFTNSDVAVFFLEILPMLRPGVLVHVHDVFLPSDYPAEWIERFYSEQYLLAANLLAKQPSVDIVLPNYYVGQNPELRNVVAPLLEIPKIGAVRTDAFGQRGGFLSIWLRTR